MKKSIISIMVLSAMLAGCNNDDSLGEVPPTEVIPPTDVVPPTEIIPPITYIGQLQSSGQLIKGEVDCNGQRVIDGRFEVLQGISFDCRVGNVVLGEFTAPFPNETRDQIQNGKIETREFNSEVHHSLN
ncbi:hypothetical protein [Shewanella sp. ECSMB14102]|uniref:hypothetical protein n=1 Tax=Shewanella sp. ECSMB14102 TaxID=1579504 RepID=UPI00057A8975|nr:hypothetical protein [Shewanella sp. ECSMB14102]